MEGRFLRRSESARDAWIFLPEGGAAVQLTLHEDVVVALVIYEVHAWKEHASHAFPVRRAPWDALTAEAVWPRTPRFTAALSRGARDFASFVADAGPPPPNLWQNFDLALPFWIASRVWVREERPLFELCLENDVDERRARDLGIEGRELAALNAMRQIREVVRDHGCLWLPKEIYMTRINVESLEIMELLQRHRAIRVSKQQHIALAWMVERAGVGVGKAKDDLTRACEIAEATSAAAKNPRTRAPPLRRLPLDEAYWRAVPLAEGGKWFEVPDPRRDQDRALDAKQRLLGFKSGCVIGICGDVFRASFGSLLGPHRALRCVADCAPFKAGDVSVTDGVIGVRGTKVPLAHHRFSAISFVSAEDLCLLPRTYDVLFAFGLFGSERVRADCRAVAKDVVFYS